MEAEEELAKETVRAFQAGLHGEEYVNPFTDAEETARARESAALDDEPPGDVE